MNTNHPIRTCIGCGQKRFKYELLRIVRTLEKKVEIDLKAKKPGRAAYLCYNADCIETASRKKRINNGLKVAPSLGFRDELLRVLHGRN